MPGAPSSLSTRVFDVVRFTPDGSAVCRDAVAAEEPLQIRLQGEPFIVTMRTPGADADLATGFFLAEGVIERADQIRSIRHCEDTPEAGNVLDVMLTGEAATRLEHVLAERRQVVSTSACGICGRRSIDDLLKATRRVRSDLRLRPAVIATLPDRLRATQALFAETGGLHAAALFDADGAVHAVAEDVGRHNAVDKVIGSQLRRGRLPLAERLLFVSGRTSFEIVQKAVAAGVPVVAAVSAPSSLAVDLAREAGMTLVGFVRQGTFNVYAGSERIAPP